MDRRETQVTSRTSSVVTLAVTEHGEPSASTHLLLVHGFPDDQRMWGPMVAELPPDWHLVTYDVRGSGRSTHPNRRCHYRTELLVEDCVSVLEATLPEGARVHLVGHDWGSVSLWDVVAAETWDSRLAGRLASFTSLSGPPLDHLGTLSATWRGRLRLLPQLRHSWYVLLFRLPWLPEQIWRHLQWLLRAPLRLLDPTTDLLPWGPDLTLNTSHSIDLYRANTRRRLRNPLPWRTSVPVLLVVAARDGFVTPRALEGLQDRCSNLTQVTLHEGHWLPRARPKELAELVADFVARHA